MTETNKALWSVKKEIYKLMKAGEVYTSHSINELSGDKFTGSQVATHLRSLWTMDLLEMVEIPKKKGDDLRKFTHNLAYLKLPGMKLELVGKRYKVIREAEQA